MNRVVNIELDKTRHIYFGFKAQGIAEEMLGVKSFLNYMSTNGENIGIKDIGIILYAGLVNEDPNLSIDKVIELVDEHSDTITALEAVAKAVGYAMNNGKEVVADEGSNEKNA